MRRKYIVEEVATNPRTTKIKRGRIRWFRERDETPKPKFVMTRSITGQGEIVPPKRRREKGEALAIAEKVLNKLFKREIMVPSNICIEALQLALGHVRDSYHVRGAMGQIYNLRDRLGYMSIRNPDTNEKFWIAEEYGVPLCEGQDIEELF